MQTVISVFAPNSRKQEAIIESLIEKQAVDALEERLGKEAGKRARRKLSFMRREEVDLIQFRLGDRRIRIKTAA